MATCVVRPSLLNKFTFRQVYLPPTGEAHRCLVMGGPQNLLLSPEWSDPVKIIRSLDLGYNFIRQDNLSALAGVLPLRRGCYGAAGFGFAPSAIGSASVTRFARTDDGLVWTPSGASGPVVTPERMRLVFGNGRYATAGFTSWGIAVSSNGYTYTQLGGDSITAARTNIVYCQGRFYYPSQGGGSYMSTDGVTAATAVAGSDWRLGASAENMPALTFGRNMDALIQVANTGVAWVSDNLGVNWTAGGPIGPANYNGRWPRMYFGLGRFGEEVLFTVSDNGEVGALSVDRGQTWRNFPMPPFCAYVGNWIDNDVIYVPNPEPLSGGRWLAALGSYGIWELTPDYRI